MPTSIEALLIVTLVLAPGYICSWCVRQKIQQAVKQSDIELILSVVAAGAFIHVIAFPLLGRRILSYYDDGPNTLLRHEWAVFVWGIGTVFVVPVAVGLLIGTVLNQSTQVRLLRSVGLDYVSRTVHAWNWAVRRQDGCFVRVYLQDGTTVIGGAYSTQSFAASESDSADLFIEEVWELDDDGWFVQPAPYSRGMWIAPGLIGRVEFLESVIESKEDIDGEERS